jgi:7,8-dihydro-6-hydroxymethylpterin dimethyltransferase
MQRRAQDPWNFLFIAGMWFQDLFNYDFRRTEMCIIPYGTQQGEISFCAYNTGIGWRNIIENMHKNATVAEWYRNHGKHEIYAKGKNVALASYEHSLVIDEEDAARVRHIEHDIPVTAAEENRIRRKKALEEQAKVRAIYEELVLKKPQQPVVQIGSLNDIAKAVPANFANSGKPVTIAPANGNGHSNGNDAAKTTEAAAEAVAGD